MSDAPDSIGPYRLLEGDSGQLVALEELPAGLCRWLRDSGALAREGF